MADPIREQISQQVLATLQTITEANGYNQTLTVARHNPEGDAPAHLAAYLYEGDPEPAARLTGKEVWTIRYAVSVDVLYAPSGTVIDQAVNRVEADIQKALLADLYRTNGDGTRLATKTDWLAPQRFANEKGNLAGVVCFIEVTYRHKENDPYTL